MWFSRYGSHGNPQQYKDTMAMGPLPLTQTFESQAKILIKASEDNIARIESQIRGLERLRDQERGNIARLRMAIAPVSKASCRASGGNLLLAHTTPRLWTERLMIDLNKTPTAAYISCVKEWLKRSAPIRIPVELKISEKGVEAGPLMDEMAAVAYRWGSANLDLPSLSLLSRIPAAGLKSLVYLSLQSEDVKHHEKTRPFRTAEHLHRVFLRTHHTSRLLLPWSQLTDIDVSDPSPQECLDTLLQCTTVVSAQFYTSAWSDFPDLSQRPITTLGRLKVLRLSFDSLGDFVAPFFVCLALPVLAKLTLTLDIDHTWPSAEFTQFQLRSPNIERLTFGMSAMEPPDLLAVLQHAPLLVALDMDCCLYCFDDSIIGGLQYSATDAVYLTPKLERLSLSYAGTNFDEDTLDAMIQSRWWTDEQLLSLPSSPKVARWSHVDIYCDDGADNVSSDFKARIEEYRSQGLDISVS
ncbi:hypothetical protein MSAN_01336500 [Mycena sanguinolenta]|uniref:Uncharacterized protein n=1 Tax=Mycena sanguinolenta TaxID=230812 RepID=A0A8H6YAH4_9AGAR|nr:hypothetical protein MSAN_01336500 [Mycena sanguinolenta]